MATGARRHLLAAQIPTPADHQTVADAAVTAWRDIETTLSPVIGRLGFGALYRRSVELRTREDPWLAEAHHGVSPRDGFAALHAALGRRPRVEAEDAQRGLLLTFHQQLVSLLGASLAARLLPRAHPREP